MDARTLNIRTIFGQDRRHLVPLYQRPYVWKRDEQWEPLWEDICGVATKLGIQEHNTRPHFLGAIVLDQMRKPTGHVETRLVIDGQQRLTTVQLFLEAFCDYCDQIGAEKHFKGLLKLTRNDDPMSEDPDEQYKVWPTNVDQEHFRRIMEARSPEELRKLYGVKPTAEVRHPIGDGYLFFYQSITDWISHETEGWEERLQRLYETVHDYIRMVVIDLGTEDDPQLIFETLNARGTPLLPSDLVKNFLFHRAQQEGDVIDQLYVDYWRGFDDRMDYWRAKLGRGHAQRARVDVFLQHYLTLIRGEEVGVAYLYTAFRDYANNGAAGKTRDILESIRTYADAFERFDSMPKGTREAQFFSRLRDMDLTTAYPFLLELFVVHGKDTVYAILNDLESFLVRRLVCQLSTRGYNRLFLDLLNALQGSNGEAALRVRELLLSSDAESTRWPKDGEFHRAWIDTPVFRILVRARVRMMLEALESAMRSDKSEKLQGDEKLTIEHLLPQDWRKHWPLPDGEPDEEAEVTRERLLHTMGNLTLLTNKLNPSISNGPWEKKLPAILEYSVLTLNKKLKSEDWNEERILARGEALFRVARGIWPHPEEQA